MELGHSKKEFPCHITTSS